MLVPLVSVAVAVTLLPALLASVGPRLDWPRIRKENNASRVWTAWARGIYRHRWPAAILGIAILGLLAFPALSLQLGEPSSTSLSTAGPARDTLNTLTTGRRSQRHSHTHHSPHQRLDGGAGAAGARHRRRRRGGHG